MKAKKKRKYIKRCNRQTTMTPTDRAIELVNWITWFCVILFITLLLLFILP